MEYIRKISIPCYSSTCFNIVCHINLVVMTKICYSHHMSSFWLHGTHFFVLSQSLSNTFNGRLAETYHPYIDGYYIIGTNTIGYEIDICTTFILDNRCQKMVKIDSMTDMYISSSQR